MDFMKKYEYWLNSDSIDEKDKEELRGLKDNLKEIEDRFFKDLSFGTGGIRGVRGIGTNRINKYVIRKVTQGLANYMLKFDADKAKKQGIDARVALSEKAKELLKEQVDKIAEQAKQDINKATKLAELGKIEESRKEAIKVVGVVNIPAKKVIVKSPTNLTAVEKEEIKKAIEAVNPGATVVIDDKGNATVTLNGNTVTIAKDQLVKSKDDVKAKNSGDNINLNFDKVLVSDINNISKEDKVKFQYMILGAIADVEEFDINSLNIEVDDKGNAVITSKDGKTKLVVTFDDKGNATIITLNGQVLAISAEMIFKEKAAPKVTLPEKVKVEDALNLTDEEKAAVKEGLIKANPEIKDAKVTVSATGETTIVYPDGRVVVIPAEKLVEAKHSENNSGQEKGQGKRQGLNAKLGQRLANTGTTETNTGLAGLGMAVLGGLLAAARRHKEKE